MSAASSTEAWAYENLPRIEQCVAEYEQEKGKKPGLVVMTASTAMIVSMDLGVLDTLPPDLRSSPAVIEVIHRHKTGAYLGEDGKQCDVPIICEAATVYRTSLETIKMKLELMALGVTFVGREATVGHKRGGGAMPVNRFKQRKRRR